MAIYEGTWRNGEGVPFDPNAFGRDDQVTGRACQVRRRRRVSNARTIAFTNLMRTLAHKWRTELAEWEKNQWLDLAAGGGPSREYFGDPPGDMPSFAAFCCSNAPSVAAYGELHVTDYRPGAGPWPAFRYQHVYADTQRIQFDFTGWPPDPPGPFCSHFFYQIHPAKTYSNRRQLYTRLIGTTLDCEHVDGTMYADFPLAWNVEVGDKVAVLACAAARGNWGERTIEINTAENH